MKRTQRTCPEPSGLSSQYHQVAQSSSRQRFEYLDGLRGLAILLVVMIHSSQLVTDLLPPLRNFAFYGVRGVQLFFIVSGMTLTLTYQDQKLEWGTFLTRRFFRIAPMFYSALIVYLALGQYTDMQSGAKDATPLDILSTIIFMHGWIPTAINKVVPGGWSIAAEAMFYLIFPSILFFTASRKHLITFVLLTYLCAGATYTILSENEVTRPLAMAFWLCQLPAFAGGCLLGTFCRPRKSGPHQGTRVVLFLSVALLILDSQFRGRSNLLVAIFLFTTLVWAVSAAQPRFFTIGVLPKFGKISFSLYLVHFLLLDFIRPLAPAMENSLGGPATFSIIFVLVLLVGGVVSALCYQWIELPGIRFGRAVCAKLSNSQ